MAMIKTKNDNIGYLGLGLVILQNEVVINLEKKFNIASLVYLAIIVSNYGLIKSYP